MQYEYDPNKSASNKEKHGIDFDEAQTLWRDRFALAIPAKFQGEERFGLIGKIAGTMWTAIFTMRGEITRLISCRPSRKSEVAFYEKTKQKHNQRRRV